METMVRPAKRVESVEEYYFSVKLKEIAQMNANGDDVINLGIGSPDLPPAENVVRTLSENAKLDGSHGYQPYVGIVELRSAFSKWYKRWYGVELDPANEILPLIGSKEGIMHISMAFLNEGDGVLVPNPGYPTYSSVSKLVGAKIYTYTLSEDNDWYPNFDAIEAADAAGEISLANTKLMWCNYPNMPTGANGSMEIFEKLVAFGKKHNTRIEPSLDAETLSLPKTTFKDWYYQKLRHLSTVDVYKSGSKMWIGLEPLTRGLFYLAILLLIVLGYNNPIILAIALGAFLFRFLIQLTIINLTAKVYKDKGFGLSIILFDIILPLVTLYILTIGKIFRRKAKFIWK